eukprot:5295251-Prorocentrum_lima.AAC.1
MPATRTCCRRTRDSAPLQNQPLLGSYRIGTATTAEVIALGLQLEEARTGLHMPAAVGANQVV